MPAKKITHHEENRKRNHQTSCRTETRRREKDLAVILCTRKGPKRVPIFYGPCTARSREIPRSVSVAVTVVAAMTNRTRRTAEKALAGEIWVNGVRGRESKAKTRWIADNIRRRPLTNFAMFLQKRP